MTRKEALEYVKNMWMSKETHDALETLIPEFGESEDENLKNKSGYYKAGKFWKASTLWNATKDKIPQRVPNRYILQNCTWNIGTLQEFANEVKNIQEVSLDYPIILDINGNILDGAHRVVKAYLEDKDIDIVYLGDDEWPEPDYDEEKAVKESEDEKIRKFIQKLLITARDTISNSSKWEQYNDALTWLEKQKEQKPLTIESAYEKFVNPETLKEARINKYIRAQLLWELMHNGIITEVDYQYLTDDKRKPWTVEEYRIAYQKGFEMSEQLKRKDQQPTEWNPTNEDVILFNKAIITNTTLTPDERAKLDIIRMKFKHRPVIKQEKQKEQKGYDEAYLQEKIAKASKTWEGVDVDEYLAEVRGKQKEWKPADIHNFKIFATDLAKQFNIEHRRDIDWDNFCVGLLSYFKEQKPRINIDQLKSMMLQYLQEAANEKDDSDIEADTDKWARKILGYDFEENPTAKINGEPISTENQTVKVGDDETEVQKAYREGMNAGRKEVFDHPEYYGLQLRRMYDYETEKRNPEWSEEDEKVLDYIIKYLTHYDFNKDEYYKDMSYSAFCKLRVDTINFLKSLRPQSKDEIYKEKDEAFKLGKHQLAIAFMNYLDENRLEGKMGLSNAECEDIDKAFKENDWAKIMRYIEKYSSHWKPTEEQMEALKNSAYGVYQNGDGPILRELYEQLLKLGVKDEKV